MLGRTLWWLGAMGLGLVGCAEEEPGDAEPTTTGDTDVVVDCDYPEGAVEPMELGEVLYPYKWNQARHRDGREGHVDLAEVACNTDPDTDWSPFDVLLFVSIPAW